MTSPEGQEHTYSDNKYKLQNTLVQLLFGVSDEEMRQMEQGENEKDPRLAKMLEWVINNGEAMSNALAETPEPTRAEIFTSLNTNPEAAAKKFLSVHPELRPEEETLH